MKLTSSWMNEIVQLQKDQELGEFSLEIPVDSSQLDKNGFFRYVRKELEERPEAQKRNGTIGRHINPQLASCFQPAME